MIPSRLFLLGLCSFVFLATAPCFAYHSTQILAIVGNALISSADVDRRMSIFSPGMFDGVDNSGIRRDILNSLIDEKVIFDKADAEGISLSADELLKLTGEVEEHTKRDPRIDADSMLLKFEASALWNKMIAKIVVPAISVSKTEVQDLKEQFKNFNTRYVKVVNVSLPAGLSEETLSIIRAKAIDLPGLLSVCNEFAFNVMHMGWMPISHLNPNIRLVVQSLRKKGGVSSIVAGPDGSSMILALDDYSELPEGVMGTQASFILLEASDKRLLEKFKGRHIACDSDDLADLLRKFKGIKASDVNVAMVRDLQDDLRNVVGRSEEGVLTQPFRAGSKSQWLSVLPCKLEQVEGGDLYNDESAYSTIFNQKLAVQQKFFLDKIRDAVPIEVVAKDFKW